MLSKKCLQVKCIGIKKMTLLLMSSNKNSWRKYFEVSALCGIREFLWGINTPTFLTFQITTLLYLDCEHCITFQVTSLPFTMTSLFHLANCFLFLCWTEDIGFLLDRPYRLIGRADAPLSDVSCRGILNTWAGAGWEEYLPNHYYVCYHHF